MPIPLTTNAADPAQVKRAARKEKDAAAIFRTNLRATMATAEGRAVMWELLAKAGVFRSVWHPSAAIHYNAGRQDYGHELMADLIATDEELYQLMEREARTRARREDLENEAARTPTNEDRGVTNGR